MSGWLASAWARIFVSALVRCGVRLAVLSPGSRSTPLALALLEDGGLDVRVVLDERAAAFLAVGWAKVTGTPAVLVCTSGSAGAHYLPALVEARHAGAPVIAVTADRPPELQACGASQTIDQRDLFGVHALCSYDLGAPAPHPAALAGVAAAATRAVHAARARRGPVHVNAPFRKPLEPAEPIGAEVAMGAAIDALASGARCEAPPPVRLPPRDALESLASALLTAARPLIVAGPLAPSLAPSPGAVLELLRATRAVLCAESTSQLRHAPERALAAARWVDDLGVALEAELPDEALPDLVLQLGPMPVGAAWERCFARPAVARVVLSPFGWHDPTHSAVAHLEADLEPTLRALVETIERLARAPGAAGEPPPHDLRSLAAAAARARERLALPSGDGLSEGEAVLTVARALRDGELLVVGNGLPVRELDQFAPGRELRLQVVSQRGAAGIDGLIAGAVGAALAAARPATLLLGDLAFLHDVGSLPLAAASGLPLRVVVLDNDGGRIFEQLPVAIHARTRPRLDAWTTPHGLDLAAAAGLARLPCTVARAPAELARAVASAPTRPELVLAKLDPTSPARDRRALLAAVAEELAASFSSA